jgi:hypothetical protein
MEIKGDVILRLIQTSSKMLNAQLLKLRDQQLSRLYGAGKLVRGEYLLDSVSSSITYLEKLDSNLASAQDIQQVNVQVCLLFHF